jgi:hypothetical protein
MAEAMWVERFPQLTFSHSTQDRFPAAFSNPHVEYKTLNHAYVHSVAVPFFGELIPGRCSFFADEPFPGLFLSGPLGPIERLTVPEVFMIAQASKVDDVWPAVIKGSPGL